MLEWWQKYSKILIKFEKITGNEKIVKLVFGKRRINVKNEVNVRKFA